MYVSILVITCTDMGPLTFALLSKWQGSRRCHFNGVCTYGATPLPLFPLSMGGERGGGGEHLISVHLHVAVNKGSKCLAYGTHQQYKHIRGTSTIEWGWIILIVWRQCRRQQHCTVNTRNTTQFQYRIHSITELCSHHSFST